MFICTRTVTRPSAGIFTLAVVLVYDIFNHTNWCKRCGQIKPGFTHLMNSMIITGGGGKNQIITSFQ
jgi:hypothetical protein